MMLQNNLVKGILQNTLELMEDDSLKSLTKGERLRDFV